MTNDGVTRILNLDERTEAAVELDRLRRNITVLFTDIKGSTAYFERFGDSAGLLMVHHINTMLGKIVEQHSGRVIKTIGDAVMASFEDPAQAVSASIEMQKAVTADSAAKPENRRVSVRIGINFGLGFVKSNDVFGDVVNVASRVEAAATPEQILISDTLHEAIAFSDSFRLRLAGRFSLKGKSEERNLYEVIWREGTTADAAFATMIGLAAGTKFKLVQVRSDGQPAREFEFTTAQCLIGRSNGHFTFPNDEFLQPVHACFTIEAGQMYLEPLPQADTFFSVVGSHRLQHGDIVSFGAQVLEFHVDEAAVAAAAESGGNVASLHGAVAEFISLNPDEKRYPIRDQQTTWGRTKATYTFPTDTAMSRSHAKVYYRGEDFFLEDTGSTNGTFVLAREKTALPPGVVLSMGGQRLKLLREEPQGKAVQVG